MSALPLLAMVQDAQPTIVPADTAWMLISTALVLLMTPALAFSTAAWSAPRIRSTR